jgi:hypothetical protein
MICANCTSENLASPGSVFVEYGQFDGRRYQEEGYADVHRCVECGFQFADLSTFELGDIIAVEERDEDTAT